MAMLRSPENRCGKGCLCIWIVWSIVVLLVVEKDFEKCLEAFNCSLMACPTNSVLIVAFTCGYIRCFYLLQNLSWVKSFNICIELDDNQEIFCALFKLMFSIVK